MSDSRRSTTPVQTLDEVSRQYQRGRANVRTQERVARSGENVHSEVLRSVAELPRTFSEPRSTRSVRTQPVVEQRTVRRRPSLVHTPSFQSMISQLNKDSAEAIRDRTAERVQRLGTSEPSESGEESLSERIDAVGLGRDFEQKETGVNDYEQEETNGNDFGASSGENDRFYNGYNSQQTTPRAKYYAVQRGRRPGIYRTWEECEKQVEGFSHCAFKSFKTKPEAQQYLAAAQPTFEYSQVRASAQRDGYDRDSVLKRNDAVHPVIGTVQRRNITHRRSQDRARDRVSLGEPSLPVEMLGPGKLNQGRLMLSIRQKLEHQLPHLYIITQELVTRDCWMRFTLLCLQI